MYKLAGNLYLIAINLIVFIARFEWVCLSNEVQFTR